MKLSQASVVWMSLQLRQVAAAVAARRRVGNLQLLHYPLALSADFGESLISALWEVRVSTSTL